MRNIADRSCENVGNYLDVSKPPTPIKLSVNIELPWCEEPLIRHYSATGQWTKVWFARFVFFSKSSCTREKRGARGFARQEFKADRANELTLYITSEKFIAPNSRF